MASRQLLESVGCTHHYILHPHYQRPQQNQLQEQHTLNGLPSTQIDGVDQLDRAPSALHVTVLDVIGFYVSIGGHLLDVAFDLNIAIRYYANNHVAAFWWTLAFLLFPAFVNTAVSIKMYTQDKDKHDSLSKKMTKRMIWRIVVLIFQMAPILRYVDALRYALKARKAEKEGDTDAQRKWYCLMLREDSDAALLRAFECFLEAAPQQVLQLSLMIEGREEFKIHQTLSVISSVISMGWCLAAYQRAVRFAQDDKDNISWAGSIMQLLWHFLVTVSRIMSIAVVAYLFPLWAVLACGIHALLMAAWLQFFERSPFCSDILCGVMFSLIMGLVYIFTYIMPVEGRTRYRYALYYSVCLIEDIVCMILWIMCANSAIRSSPFFNPITIVTILPYILGIICMIMYYECLHPKMGIFGKHNRMRVRDCTNHQPRENNLAI